MVRSVLLAILVAFGAAAIAPGTAAAERSAVWRRAEQPKTSSSDAQRVKAKQKRIARKTTKSKRTKKSSSAKAKTKAKKAKPTNRPLLI